MKTRQALPLLGMLSIGFFAGLQICALNLLFDNAHFGHVLTQPITTTHVPPGAIQLHDRVIIHQDTDAFNNYFRPKINDLLQDGHAKLLQSCPSSQIDSYVSVLQNLQSNPEYYEDGNPSLSPTKNCPVLLLFYVEGGSQAQLQRWIEYYSNLQTKRCIKLLSPRRYRNSTETNKLVGLGYELVGTTWAVKQDKVINTGLHAIQKDEKNYGADTIVSVNDLDHLMAWFGEDGDPHRYASYSDMVAVYILDLLSLKGCGDQMVEERYAIPCTCVLEDNIRYIDLRDNPYHNKTLIWSEYGKSNKFHPTANFYMRNGKPQNLNLKDWGTGTVYANLRGFDQDAITHHKIAHKTKGKTMIKSRHAGMLHYRSDGYLTSTTKYMHFLLMNGWASDHTSTVEDVMFCATGKTMELIPAMKRCRDVKEIANVLSLVHQKRLCLQAGHSEEHCLDDLSCCVTEPDWPGR